MKTNTIRTALAKTVTDDQFTTHQMSCHCTQDDGISRLEFKVKLHIFIQTTHVGMTTKCRHHVSSRWTLLSEH